MNRHLLWSYQTTLRYKPTANFRLLQIFTFNCPYRQFFFLTDLILYITQWTSAKEKFDLDKMQSFFRSFKNVQICHHFGPPFGSVSLRFE